MKVSEKNLRWAIKEAGLTIEKFVELLDYQRQTFYRHLEKGLFDDDTIVKMAKILKVKKEAIIDTIVSSASEPNINYLKPNVVYVPISAQAGYLTGYPDKVYEDALEHYYLPGLQGKHWQIQVKGMSMSLADHPLSEEKHLPPSARKKESALKQLRS